MNEDTPETARRVERNIKLAAVIMLALVAIAATAFWAYLLNDMKNAERQAELEKARTEAQAEGYAAALQQLVEASEANSEMSVTVGEKTVRLIVVSPTEAVQTIPTR